MCLALRFSGVVFIMLINAKMPTIVGNCWHFNIYEQDLCFLFIRCLFLLERGSVIDTEQLGIRHMYSFVRSKIYMGNKVKQLNLES